MSEGTADPIDVVLADDHPLLLKGLCELVNAEPGFTVTGTAGDGLSVISLIEQLRPNIAVLDLTMPEISGLGVLKRLARQPHPPKVVFLTAMIGDDQVLEAMAAGVSGIILKETAPEALIDCLREVAAGRKWLTSEMIQAAVSHRTNREQQDASISSLTPRERQIAELVCEGRPNKVIARMIGVSAGTVRIHLHNIYVKLQITNRTALAALLLGSRP